MIDKYNYATSGGIGFFGLLGIVFIVLKLCGVIAWSWWWVLAPIYAPTLIVLLILFIILIITAIGMFFKKTV